jgi:phosphotransacetylase/MFS family permease
MRARTAGSIVERGISPVSVPAESNSRQGVGAAAIAWVITATYYFYQYTLRSAPSVMIPQLSEAFGVGALGVASIVGLFYYGYSPFSLVAGVAIDRLGPRRVLPIGASAVGAGALLFASGSSEAASVGRFLQGAGGVFALVGAIYIASRYFPPSQAATLIGATQMFGMAGGAAGQFAVGPLIGKGFAWNGFWAGMGIAGLAIGGLLLLLLPKEKPAKKSERTLGTALEGLYTIFKNPQSILCGLIAGFLFIPTTIFDMIWGVRYLQEAHGFDYASAVMRSATVPAGWVIGCPLLGFISDRIGRRKPVIFGGATTLLACMAWILFGRTGVFPPYIIGLVAGVASGSAMLPYTVIKEANPPELGGTATGVINFVNFTFSALLGPIFAWILQQVSGATGQMESMHYQTAFAPLLLGIIVAIVLTLVLKETGWRRPIIALRLKTGGLTMSRGIAVATGTGKYEALLERCQQLQPIATAVAHPCEITALSGAIEAAEKGLISPILVGPRVKIESTARAARIDLGGCEIVDVPHSHASAAKAVELLRDAKAELLMKGSLHTDELMAAVISREGGLRTGRRISHAFVMDIPTYHKVLIVTDGAINISPSLEDKVDICQNAIDLAISLGREKPKVAVLAAVETVTSKMPATIDAAALCKMAERGQISGAIFDGPLAFDNAIDKSAAQTKGIHSEVAGDPDILLAPDLEAGNILAKQLTFLANAESAGLVLGARVPIILTSRADSVRSRIASCAVAMLVAHARRRKH